MERIVYINGDFVPESEAKLSIFDRGFLFADAVYEVSAILQGKLVENAPHLARLHRSLREMNIPAPASDEEIIALQEKLIALNKVDEGGLYMQISRGIADRNFVYSSDMKPSMIMFTQHKNLLHAPQAEKGIAVLTKPDQRWARRDIKTVSLLASSMAVTSAVQEGADDAWMVDPEGYVTEGSSNNAYIVTPEGTLITRHLSNDILHGITRKAVLALSKETGIPVEERPFTPEEAHAAQEAFMTAATAFVWPVVKIDNHVLGDGTPGPIYKKLRQLYIDMALEQVK